MARLRRPVGVLPLTRGYPGPLPSVQGDTFPHSSSENLTLHRGAMDGGAWLTATAGTPAETRLNQAADGSMGTRSSRWFDLCHLLARRVAGRASSLVRRISSAPGMGGRQFFNCPRLGGSGTTRGGGEWLLGGYGAAGGRNWREVVRGRRIESCKLGCSRGNHGGRRRLGIARGRRPGNLLWWAQAVVREFLLRSKAVDRGMGMAWARGAATCGGRSSQWQLDVRAPASADTPRGTGLGAWRASTLPVDSAHGTGLGPAVP
jgi:hypothetical protein